MITVVVNLHKFHRTMTSAAYDISEDDLLDVNDPNYTHIIIHPTNSLPSHSILLLSEQHLQGWFDIWPSSFFPLILNWTFSIRNSGYSYCQSSKITGSSVILSACVWFSPLAVNTIHPVMWTQIASWSPDLLTNRESSRPYSWRRRWLSACADPFQVIQENNILLITFHWLIIRL